MPAQPRLRAAVLPPLPLLLLRLPLLVATTLVAGSCGKVVATGIAADMADEALAFALEGDDECLARSDSSSGEAGTGCGLNALQRGGARMVRTALALDGAAVPPMAAASGDTFAQAREPAAAGPGQAENPAGVREPVPALALPALGPRKTFAVAWGWTGEEGSDSSVGLSAASLLRWMAIGLLLACCTCDLAARWHHRACFLECRRKVQHVHRELLRQDRDQLLCPYCIEFVRSEPISSKVVFHCGHCFHLHCANSFFREHEDRAGLCPICSESGAEAGRTGEAVAGPQALLAPEGADGSPCGSPSSFASGEDCGRSFLLASLRRMYPDAVSEACVHRWASCHVETWLQELTCPKYKSLFRLRR